MGLRLWIRWDDLVFVTDDILEDENKAHDAMTRIASFLPTYACVGVEHIEETNYRVGMIIDQREPK
jgi:hypothetical protein